jgi:small conductance mechanosensitive channel
MPIRLLVALLIAVTLAAPSRAIAAGPSADSTATRTSPIAIRIAALRAMAAARDSLSAVADTTRGNLRDVLEEALWQRHLELHAGLLDVAERIEAERKRGGDVTEARRDLTAAVLEEWPRYLIQLRRHQTAMTELGRASEAATGNERLAIETAMSQQSDRLVDGFRSLVNVLLALDRAGIDVSGPRALLLENLPPAAEGLVNRLKLAQRDLVGAGLRLSRDASNADLRYAFESAEERARRANRSLTAAIGMMDRLGLETTPLKVELIATTGKLTSAIFGRKVLLGLARTMWLELVEFLAGKALQWLIQGLLIVLTFVGFRALSRLVRGIVRRAVVYSNFTQLMRGTIIRLSSHGVMAIGFLVILRQLGVQLAPLLAGLGIAGVVVGFAMQNTLSNFAAGGMILGNQPFDVGDEIEVAGVSGVVKRMTLVATTILTPDNQTLIVPNSTVWGGVIRNRTSQPIRRVDLSFGIGYGDDVERAERVLREIVAAESKVLAEPAPDIRLHQLADSSVNFVVRAWTSKEQFWNVYWGITRAVKLRFDREGISIPFPQRDVHLHMSPGTATPALPPDAARPES